MLRPGLDASHDGQPDHPDHVHDPAPPGQHGHLRRRRQRASRRAQRPGLHGPLHPVRQPARLPEDAVGLPGHAGQVPREVHAQVERPPVGELLPELPEVLCQLPQGPLSATRQRPKTASATPGFPSSTTERRLLPDAPLRRDVQGQDQGPLRRRHRPGGQLPEHDQGPQGPREPRLARRREHLRQRDLLLLEGPRRGPREGQDGGLPPARLGLHGKGGQPEQQRPVGPVEVQGRRGPRRRDPRRRDHDQDPRCRQGPLCQGRGRLSGAHPEPQVGLQGFAGDGSMP